MSTFRFLTELFMTKFDVLLNTDLLISKITIVLKNVKI